MKRWIKFPFKNILLYCVILCVLLYGLCFFMIKDGEYGLAVGMGSLSLIALVGGWFGCHYGIRITDKNYILICSATVKKYPVEKVKSIEVYFVTDEEFEKKKGKNGTTSMRRCFYSADCLNPKIFIGRTSTRLKAEPLNLT